MKRLSKAKQIPYFETIVTSFITGEFEEAKQRFEVLPKRQRHSFLKLTSKGIWENKITTKYTNKLAELLNK